ncbi:hypothetical protein [Deinococcus roseus]|uniref:Uncharacterized protein n=1 Tax=Deinococcus roseus TaxID=392414 RepID=A0ABQ2DKH4_9DEIO|nr:hypothetical protein [Deinococcus roseus]GGJ59585.1 hypothetical protein GCM10008938_52140 [Deinococcus roseus]
MEIDIEKLNLVFNRILDRISSLENASIKLEADYYWMIPGDQLTNLNLGNIDPVIGSLSDDWMELSKLLDTERPVSFVDLDRLANLLRMMSEEYNPTNS